MHLVVDFAASLARRYDDLTAAGIVARHGIKAQPMSMYCAQRATHSSFVLGYACADEPPAIIGALRRVRPDLR